MSIVKNVLEFYVRGSFSILIVLRSTKGLTVRLKPSIILTHVCSENPKIKLKGTSRRNSKCTNMKNRASPKSNFYTCNQEIWLPHNTGNH